MGQRWRKARWASDVVITTATTPAHRIGRKANARRSHVPAPVVGFIRENIAQKPTISPAITLAPSRQARRAHDHSNHIAMNAAAAAIHVYGLSRWRSKWVSAAFGDRSKSSRRSVVDWLSTMPAAKATTVPARAQVAPRS